MNAQTQPEMTPLRKISPKTVYGKIPNPPEKGVKTLYQVIGQAVGIREGTKEFGGEERKYTALVGNFEAVNVDTGEVFSAPECFLPEPFNTSIANNFRGDGEKPMGVDFALEIGIKAPGEGQTVRYNYTAKMIHDPSKADPLAHLRDRLPRLAAPKKDGDESDEAKKSKGKK